VACLGLFGLATFTAEQRTKEIGVRKVLGATVPNIVLLLSRDFTKLVIIAFLIATPLSYVLIGKWLENFASRISIGWGGIYYCRSRCIADCFAHSELSIHQSGIGQPGEKPEK
jgi:ABC-type antimicrobial peptide transport system permease subunit